MSSLIVAPAVLAHIEPLEGLVLPLHLSGERGRNRGQGLPQVAANDDRTAVLAWLARYRDSPATLASYRSTHHPSGARTQHGNIEHGPSAFSLPSDSLRNSVSRHHHRFLRLDHGYRSQNQGSTH